MGKLVPSYRQILSQGARGKLVFQQSAEPERKVPGWNQSVVSYQDTDGKKKWVGVEQGDNGSILYQGKTFSDANELVSTLATPIPEPTPKVAPPDAVTSAAPKVTQADKVSHSASFKAGRAAGNYINKMAVGVGAALANVGGRIARASDEQI